MDTHTWRTSAGGVMEPVRRIVDGRRADTVQRLMAAAVEEVRAVGFPEMSVRSVAKRAGVSPATAYTYFASKEHLICAVVGEKLQELPDHAPSGSAPGVIAETVRSVVRVFSDEPEMTRAYTTVLLADDPEVNRLRDQIGAEIASRLTHALGKTERAAADGITMAFVGGMLLAGMGYLSFDDLVKRLTAIAEMFHAAGAGAPEPARPRRQRRG
jgi:AcrR family transcriptional regulator